MLFLYFYTLICVRSFVFVLPPSCSLTLHYFSLTDDGQTHFTVLYNSIKSLMLKHMALLCNLIHLRVGTQRRIVSLLFNSVGEDLSPQQF